MATSIVRGKFIICKVDAAGEPVIVNDGALFVRDGIIVEIGNFPKIAEKYTADVVLGSPDHVVLPGMVNGHHHLGVTPVQLGIPDLPLELWLAARIGMRNVDPYLDTLYSAFEMIESGVTTVQHLHGRVPAPLERMQAGARAVISAYQAVGMRVSYSYGVRDQNRLVYGDDDAFAATLPAELAIEFNGWAATQRVPVEESLALFDSLHDDYEGDDRVGIQLAPVNLHWCSDETLLRIKEYAARHGVPMHMHLVETPFQEVYARRRSDGTAVEHLHRLGLLGPDLTLGHCVWVSPSDVDLIAASGTCVCHNASSNLRLRSGLAPIGALAAAGVRVAIGLDEAGINDDRDMLQELRLVLRLHRGIGHADQGPSAAAVFRMATEHGGHTTPFGSRIGTLEAGKCADMSLLDWRQVAAPYLDQRVPILDAVMQRARSGGVDTVVIGGEVVLRDGKITRVDKQAALAELTARLSVPLTEAEAARVRLSEAVLPHVRKYYESYRLAVADIIAGARAWDA